MLARSPIVGFRAALAAPPAAAKRHPATAQTLAHFRRVTVFMESLSVAPGVDADDEAGHAPRLGRRDDPNPNGARIGGLKRSRGRRRVRVSRPGPPLAYGR